MVTSVSCIIPTHDRPEGLRRALASVLAQTQPPQEVIIVDDLSAAATVEIVATLGRAGVELTVVNPPTSSLAQGSAGRSRNFGATFATSEYLAFLDDDDYWHEQFLERCMSKIAHPGVDLVLAGLVVVDQGKEVDFRRPSEELRASDVISKNPGATGSNIVISKKLFALVGGYDDKLFVYNDLDFFYRCLRTEAVYAVDPAGLAYQETAGGNHLSSRSAKRALGIRAYESKHDAHLSAADRRRLRRDIAVASRFAGQTRIKRIKFMVLTVINSELLDYTRFLRRLLERTPAQYQ